jgi:hypothetical protein
LEISMLLVGVYLLRWPELRRCRPRLAQLGPLSALCIKLCMSWRLHKETATRFNIEQTVDLRGIKFGGFILSI